MVSSASCSLQSWWLRFPPADHQGPCEGGVSLDEAAVIAGESQELPDFFGRFGYRPVLHSLYLRGVRLDAILRHHMALVDYLAPKELALACFQLQVEFPQLREDSFQAPDMLVKV